MTWCPARSAHAKRSGRGPKVGKRGVNCQDSPPPAKKEVKLFGWNWRPRPKKRLVGSSNALTPPPHRISISLVPYSIRSPVQSTGGVTLLLQFHVQVVFFKENGTYQWRHPPSTATIILAEAKVGGWGINLSHPRNSAHTPPPPPGFDQPGVRSAFVRFQPHLSGLRDLLKEYAPLFPLWLGSGNPLTGKKQGFF